uniref:Uncharacterized protein n=1 Tax=Panagrolaimus sp. ES5 TaxID=591445 RepID=A0AC34FDU3_9BILA
MNVPISYTPPFPPPFPGGGGDGFVRILAIPNAAGGGDGEPPPRSSKEFSRLTVDLRDVRSWHNIEPLSDRHEPFVYAA